MKKPLPLYFWTEPIDGEMCAVHARMRTMSRGRLLGHTVFMLVTLADRRGWQSFETIREQLRAKFKESLIANHYGQLPVLGYLDSINPDSDISRVGVC